MSLVRVSVSVRARIVVNGKYLLNRDLTAAKENKKELWPFGGGVRIPKATQQMLIDKYGGCDFEGHKGDLRFKIPEENLASFENWLKTPSTDVIKARMAEKAMQYNIPQVVTREIKFNSGPLFVREERPDWSYLNFPPNIELVPSVCFDYIFGTKALPLNKARALEALAADSDSSIELVTQQEMQARKSEQGSTIPRTCLLLVRTH